MNETPDNIKTLLDAGAACVEVRGINGGKPFAIVPTGYDVKDLERQLPAPVRKTGKIVANDTQGFIDYVEKHANVEGSTIYSDIDCTTSKCRLVAVLDDHSTTLPAWREHVCTYAPKISIEYDRWTKKSGVSMSQSDFATWLEDNLPDIASVEGMPSGAEILAMALGFEANSDKKLRSKINLQSGGYTFEFADKENDATRATMQVFERFTIGIPVFDGSASAYPLVARLKYREKDGSVSFWYELIRPDRVFKTAVSEELETIRSVTGLLTISGTAGLQN